MKNKLLFLVLLAVSQFVWAQEESVLLEEAQLSDRFLIKYSNAQSQEILHDSILERNGQILTNLLNFNSLVYLKENGPGMVSSPSFRGTSASHTAVIWNGVNINSSFLGQVDFNAITTQGLDQITLKSGGGSVAYGSSAIGGTIHLNNDLHFGRGFENQLMAGVGSFNAYQFNLNSGYSNNDLSLKMNLGRIGSDNDFEIKKWDRKNLNGQFYNQSLGIQAVYKINPKNQLKFIGNLVDGERHFSLISPNAIPTKYQDYQTRTLLEWDSQLGKFHSNLKGVYLGEEFRYFPSAQTENYEFGNAQTWAAKYNLSYQWKNLSWDLLGDFTHTEVESSQIQSAKRQIGAVGLMFKHLIGRKFLYEVSIRKEFAAVYDPPFLYSVGIKWTPLSFYQVGFHTSKNFRMPTFNDLFWPAGGNPDLNAETSYQFEWGNQIQFKGWNLQINAYHNSIQDYIQWIPSGSISVPENLGEVSIWGAEAKLNFEQKLGHHHVEFNVQYGYTRSENEQTKKQLIYVPYHKAVASLGYSWKGISAYYQMMYNGEVFTDGGNSEKLDDYILSNLGLEWKFLNKRDFRIGIQVRNLFDQAYENVENRPMVGRNFNTYINFKF